MAQHQYYPEEVLIEKMQSGEYGWLNKMTLISTLMQDEYDRYIEEREFVRYKDEQLEAAMEEGHA